MTYTFWKIIFISSGVLTVILLFLTLFFIIKFRFFELVRFLIANRNESTETVPVVPPPKKKEKPVITEKISESLPEQYSGITPDGTVIACRPSVISKASPEDFVITKNVIVINGDPSVLDQI